MPVLVIALFDPLACQSNEYCPLKCDAWKALGSCPRSCTHLRENFCLKSLIQVLNVDFGAKKGPKSMSRFGNKFKLQKVGKSLCFFCVFLGAAQERK